MHFSRRSGWLVLWGILLVAYGLAVHDAPQGSSLPLYGTVPMSVQGWAWVGCGAASLAGGVIPRVPRTIGFALAVLPPVMWTLGFLVLWVTSRREIGWQAMIIWGAVSTAVIMSSRDAEVRGHP